MNNTKIGNKEAIALLATITFNHIILISPKAIIQTTASASLLNLLYIGILVLIFTCIICFFLNKFPTCDILDISHYLGGPILKWIIGILYIMYFIFFAGILLYMFTSCLQIIYFPLTKAYYISLIFIIAGIIACNMKNNAIFRSTYIFFPFCIGSFIFLFLSNIPYFQFESIYPILGYGYFTTFVAGLCNLFAFQELAYIYFLPPLLKETSSIKKISVHSIIWSNISLLLSVSVILLMFHGLTNNNELLPLYSAVKYIEFGSFFRKMDSLFVLIWIISFVSYLGITFKFCNIIIKKLTNAKNSNIFTFIFAILLYGFSTIPKNYAVSLTISSTLYRYAYFILVIFISFFILLFSYIKKIVRKWLK